MLEETIEEQLATIEELLQTKTLLQQQQQVTLLYQYKSTGFTSTEVQILTSEVLRAGDHRAAPQALTYAHVCSRMLTYAHVCWRILMYAGVR